MLVLAMLEGEGRKRRSQRSGPTTVEPMPALEANDVWTIDFKGWYRAENGERVEPLTVRDLATRYILAVEPRAQRTEQAVREECKRLFRKHGLPRVIRVDLGTPFCGAGPYGLTALSLWWRRPGIRVEFVQRRHGISRCAAATKSTAATYCWAPCNPDCIHIFVQASSRSTSLNQAGKLPPPRLPLRSVREGGDLRPPSPSLSRSGRINTDFVPQSVSDLMSHCVSELMSQSRDDCREMRGGDQGRPPLPP